MGQYTKMREPFICSAGKKGCTPVAPLESWLGFAACAGSLVARDLSEAGTSINGGLWAVPRWRVQPGLSHKSHLLKAVMFSETSIRMSFACFTKYFQDRLGTAEL